MGGRSAEHDVSLASGDAMRQAIQDSFWVPAKEVVISPDGTWTVSEEKTTPKDALRDIDTALLALHGEWGEDGQAQALLDWFGIPYGGSGAHASALAMDKPRSRAVFRDAGLRVPFGHTYEQFGEDEESLRVLGDLVAVAHQPPFVVKPAGRGSSVGVSIVRDSEDISRAFAEAFRFDNRAVVEEYQNGTEVSCGVLEDLSGATHPLSVVQIIPPVSHAFFNYDAKYSGETQEIVPAPLPQTTTRRIQEAALAAHRALGCRHYSRTDMILVGSEPVVLELNTLPGMTPESIFPKEARASGISFPVLMERFVALALRDRNRS